MKTKSIFIAIILLLTWSCQEPSDSTVFSEINIEWPSLADSPWPVMHHDAQKTSRSPYRGPSFESIEMVSSEALEKNASIIIGSNNTIIFTHTNISTSQTILEKHTLDGTIIWSTVVEEDANKNSYTSTLSSSGSIYVPGGASGTIISVDEGSGVINWSTPLGGNLHSGISLDKDGNLYVLFGDDNSLGSLDPSGDMRWQIVDKNLYVALDRPPVTFSPDGNQLFCSSVDSLYCFSSNSQLLWSYPARIPYNRIMVNNIGDLFFYNESDSTLTCLSSDGNIVWRLTNTELNLFRIEEYTAPAMDYSGNLYFVGLNTDIETVVVSISSDGALRWSWNGFIGPVEAISDLLCDADNVIYLAYKDTDFRVAAINYDGILKSEIRSESITARPHGGIFLTSINEIILPHIQSATTTFIKIR